MAQNYSIILLKEPHTPWLDHEIWEESGNFDTPRNHTIFFMLSFTIEN